MPVKSEMPVKCRYFESIWFLTSNANEIFDFRVEGKRVGTGQVICCVAPTGTDKIDLIKCNESYTATKEAIMCGWPQGIQHERPVESVCGETLLEIKLKGMSCIVMNKKYIILANFLIFYIGLIRNHL